MTFTKDPDAVLDYSVDWSLWLAGDEISTSEWLLEEGALLEQVVASNTTTKARCGCVAGGLAPRTS